MWPHLIRGVHDLNKLKSKYYVKMLEHLFRISGKKVFEKIEKKSFEEVNNNDKLSTNFQFLS